MISLLEKKSFYDITITELCQKSELNRSTFYRYYENTHDVFVDIENELSTKCEECINSIDIKNDDSIIKPICRLLDYIQKNQKTYELLFNNISEKFLHKMIEQPIDFLKNKIEIFNINLGSSSDYIFSYIIIGTADIIKNWITNNTKESPEYIADLIFTIALNILNIDKNTLSSKK